jgi:hypothetical protein
MSLLPFYRTALPNLVEISILSYLDPKDLGRSSSASRYWRNTINDQSLWKSLFDRYQFRLEVPPENYKDFFKFRSLHSLNDFLKKFYKFISNSCSTRKAKFECLFLDYGSGIRVLTFPQQLDPDEPFSHQLFLFLNPISLQSLAKERFGYRVVSQTNMMIEMNKDLPFDLDPFVNGIKSIVRTEEISELIKKTGNLQKNGELFRIKSAKLKRELANRKLFENWVIISSIVSIIAGIYLASSYFCDTD